MALVLTRNPQQSIMIGDDIKLTVYGVRGQQVRIGIEAPDDVKIDRLEIREKNNYDPENFGNK